MSLIYWSLFPNDKKNNDSQKEINESNESSESSESSEKNNNDSDDENNELHEIKINKSKNFLKNYKDYNTD